MRRYDRFSLHTPTALEEAGNEFVFLLGSNRDVIAIKKRNTGSGSTEVHVLSAASGYRQFSLQTGTALGETGDEFEFALAPNRDLVAIKKSATGTHSTEVHVLSAESGYRQFSLQTGTALEESGDGFTFLLNDARDLVAIKKRNTGSQSTEVHILSAASGYQEFSLHTGTALAETGDEEFAFQLAANQDLIAIKRRNTGTRSTEVHVLAAASGYAEFSLHTGTALEEGGDNFDFLFAPNRDLIAVKRRGTDTNSTEVHILSGTGTAFVLSGGGARGDFEVGALEYLHGRGIVPDTIYACSVGAVNGSKLAEGGAAAFTELRDIWISLQRNEDMYVEEPWLQGLDGNMKSAFESMLGTAGVALFLPGGIPFILALGGWTASQLKNIVDTLLSARSMYNLSPIEARIAIPTIFNPVKVRTSGISLRLAVVSLETGALRLVDNSGRFVDGGTEAAVPIGQAILASSAIPMVFPPKELAGQWYVDGGVRAVLPVEFAVYENASEVFAITASSSSAGTPRGMLSKAPITSFAPPVNIVDIANRAAAEIMPTEVQFNETNPSYGFPASAHVKVIQPNFDVHDIVTIDPGLISITMAYGFMRAADTLEQADARAKALADDITRMRMEIWEREHRACSRSVAPGKEGGTPLAQPVQSEWLYVRVLKWLLNEMVNRRINLGGRVPADAPAWSRQWERHPWEPPVESPWAESSVLDAQDLESFPADGTLFREPNSDLVVVAYGGAVFGIPSLEIFAALGFVDEQVTGLLFRDGLLQWAPVVPRDGTLLREQSGAIWVVFGGARFHVPDPGTLFRLFAATPVWNLWDGALDHIPGVPRDGTLLREESGAIYLIAGGAKLAIPDPATVGRLFGNQPVRPLWDGALDSIPNAPSDDTLLRTESGTIYFIAGGAKLPVPNMETLERLYNAALVRQVWDSAVNWFPDIPRDGSLLREESGTISVIFGTAKFAVPSEGVLYRLYRGARVQQVWDGALKGIAEAPSDGTLLREESGAIYVVFGGAKFAVPDVPTLTRLYDAATVHQVWDGATDQLTDIPRDGSLLREESGAVYIICGGAKLHVPDPDTLWRLYRRMPVHVVWDGALNGLGEVPRDGTLAREESGAIYIIAGGAKFQIPDLDTLNRLYGGLPVNQVWDGALAGVPDVPREGSMLREEDGSIYFILNGKRFHVQTPADAAELLRHGEPQNVFTNALNAIPYGGETPPRATGNLAQVVEIGR